MSIESNDVCNKIIAQTPFLNPRSKLFPSMVCAVSKSDSEEEEDVATDAPSFCFGDSGGPMVIENEDELVLVGVISWVFFCGVYDIPFGATRVDSVYDFISMNVPSVRLWVPEEETETSILEKQIESDDNVTLEPPTPKSDSLRMMLNSSLWIIFASIFFYI